jgi:hypothetical protein
MTFQDNTILYAADLNTLDAKADTGVTHAARTDNPHSTTATAVGAYTTAAVDTALALKANLASLGTIASQAASAVAITGGTIDGTPIGTTTQRIGAFSALSGTINGGQRTINFNSASNADSFSTRFLQSSVLLQGTQSTVTGSATGGNAGPNQFIVQTQASHATIFAGVNIITSVQSGSPATGDTISEINGIRATARINAQSGNTGYAPVCGGTFRGEGFATMGGAGSYPGGGVDTAGYYRGSAFGAVSAVDLSSSATNYRDVISLELNIKTVAASYQGTGLLIVPKGTTVAPYADYCGIGFNTDIGSEIGFKTGIQFGMSWGTQAIASTGTLIAVQSRVLPSALDPTFANGVDLRSGVFTGLAFASTGFSVAPAGAVSQRPATSATPAANGDMVFELTSNTSLKIKVKGSDGVVRSTTLTLS